MRKILFIAALLFAGNLVIAQDLSEIKMDKSPMDAAYFPANATKRMFAKTEKQKMSLEPQMRVIYSRPSLRGRVLFPNDETPVGIKKYGDKWRAGANESTELLFYKDVKIGDALVKAGRYSLTIVPTENEWSIHINSSTDEWGSYSHNPKLDVAVIKVPVTNKNPKLESLTMLFYSPNEDNVVHLKIGWDTYVVEVPIMVQ